MGIIADFVIANASEAESIGKSVRPADTWPTLESKGADTIKLATLYCAATGAEYSQELESSFQFVGGDEQNGPWVFQFPDNILNAIAAIPDTETAAVAATWAGTEELQMDVWTVADAAELIGSLRICAHRVVANNSSLFLWLSL